MSYCHIANQIAKHCNEPEAVECQECLSSMTLSDNGNFLVCDNLECDNEIEMNLSELTEAEQYELDANLDHLTSGGE